MFKEPVSTGEGSVLFGLRGGFGEDALSRAGFLPGWQSEFENAAKFERAARAFIEAARTGDVEAMKAADREMSLSFSKNSYKRLQEIHRTAVIEAAKHNAVSTSMFMLAEDRKPYGDKDHQSLYEGAFITACRHDSLAVAKFYNNATDLPSHTIAWGFYRAPEQGRTHAWLREHMGEEAAALHDLYMKFLDHAKSGEHEQIGEILGRSSEGDEDSKIPHFVLREAAEFAVRGGHQTTLESVLSGVPWFWLPELAEIAGAEGYPEMALEIIGHAEKLHEALSKMSGLQFMYIHPDQQREDQYKAITKDKMVSKALRGAASAGSIDAVKVLIESAEGGFAQRQLFVEVAEVAIENDNTELLAWAIEDIDAKTSRSGGGRVLDHLMDQALEQGSVGCRDKLIELKGGDFIDSDHIVAAVRQNDRALFDRMLASGPSSYALGTALFTISHEMYKGKWEGTPDSHYVCELFSGGREDRRKESCNHLGLANAHDLIKELDKEPVGPLTQDEIDWVLLGAVGGNAKEAFDYSVGRASQEVRDRALKAITSMDDFNPREGAERLILPLMDAGVSADLIVNAAVYRSNRELPIKDESEPGWLKYTGPSPTAVAILEHESFPRDRVDEVLARIGNGRNMTAISKAVEIGGNQGIVDFFNAAAAEEPDLSEIVRLAPDMPYVVLKEVAERHAMNSPNSGVAGSLVDVFSGRADLLYSILSFAVYHDEGHALVEAAIQGGAPVLSQNFRNAIVRADRKMVDILLKAKGATAAVQELLERLRENGTNFRKEEQSELVAYLESQVGGQEPG